jgi:glycosyltransferase involved in cell wall biosynthesis
MSASSGVPVLIVGNFAADVAGARGVCEELALRLPPAGCPVVTTSSKPSRVLRLADVVGTVLRQRRRYVVAQVDVFSGPAFIWAEAACAALSVVGKPYVLTLHGGNLPRFAERQDARVRRLLRSAAAVTTPSRYLLERLAEYRDDVRFIPNGLDVGAYRPRHLMRAAPRLIWLRAFHRLYNPSLAVRMLPLVAARFPDVHLTMIGLDKHDGSLQEAEGLAARLGVADRVTFGGAVAKRDVPSALNAADIFLNTTTVDNAPVSVVEAMASGLCIVSTDVDGMPYLVEHERDGLLVPSDDPRAMADAVLRILDQPELAAALSRQAHQKAAHFDWSPIIGEWRSLLAATAGRAA